MLTMWSLGRANTRLRGEYMCGKVGAAVLALIAIVVLGSTGTNAQTVAPNLPVQPPDPPPMPAWTTNNLSQLNALFNSAATVDSFLQEISADDFAAGPNTREWAFSDLAGNGNVELLATLDPGGRDFINQLVCVRQVGTTFTWQVVDGYRLESLPSRIVQIVANGQHQVIVEALMAPYQATAAVPSIPHVYAWSGSTGLVQSDSAYKQYYSTTVLPNLQNALRAESTSPDGADPAMVTMYNAEIAAVQAIINQP